MENHTFINRHNLIKLVCIIAFFLSFAMSACDFRKVEAQTATNTKKEKTMESIQSATTIQHKIPPIDAINTPEIETATFALG